VVSAYLAPSSISATFINNAFFIAKLYKCYFLLTVQDEFGKTALKHLNGNVISGAKQ
jgi:hypothetical protein